jgi:hypothetical protein
MATLISDILRGVTMLGALAARRRVAWIAVRATMLTLVTIALGSSRATATCGDWLAHTNKAAVDTVDDTPSELAATELASTPNRDSRPCRGPFCGQAPSVPAAPAPAPIPTFTDQTLAVLVVQAADDEIDGNFSRLLMGAADPLAGFGRRIDHPPRT